MRCDEYSEWDEYVGLDGMKRVTENAISEIAHFVHSISISECIKENKPIPIDTVKSYMEYLDVARVALIAMRHDLDSYSMVGTIMEKK